MKISMKTNQNTKFLANVRWWGWSDLNRRPLPGARLAFRVCLAPTGFFTAPELLHPILVVRKPVIYLLEPVVMPFQQPPHGQAVARLQPLQEDFFLGVLIYKLCFSI